MGRKRRMVADLESYDLALTVWQAWDCAVRAGCRLKLRTLHYWLRKGYVVGYRFEGGKRGEWRIPKASVQLLIARLRRAA